MSSEAAFFDLYGTLVTGHIYGSLVKRRMRYPRGALRSITYMVSHLALVPLHRAGLIDIRSCYTRGEMTRQSW